MFPFNYNYGMYHGFSNMTSGSCFSSLVFWGLAIVGLWILFDKAGENGWAAIVPFYNVYVLFKITWGNGVMFLLLLIPVADVVIWIITMVKLAKAFGKGGGWACGLIFLFPIFLCIMAFSKDIAYVGVPRKTADYGNGYGQQGYQQQGYQNPYSQGYQQPGNQAPNQQQSGYQQQSPQNGQYYYQQPQQQEQQPQEAAASVEVKYCPSCGNRLEHNEKFCPKCGKAQ